MFELTEIYLQALYREPRPSYFGAERPPRKRTATVRFALCALFLVILI